jgi:hypothetical protein
LFLNNHCSSGHHALVVNPLYPIPLYIPPILLYGSRAMANLSPEDIQNIITINAALCEELDRMKGKQPEPAPPVQGPSNANAKAPKGGSASKPRLRPFRGVKFAGRKEEFAAWKLVYRSTVILDTNSFAGWNAEEQCSYLVSAVEGKALDVVRASWTAQPIVSYARLEADLQAAFEDTMEGERALGKLQQLTQKGDLETYIREFNTLKGLATSAAVLDAGVLHRYFVQGLRQDLKIGVAASATKTVEAAQTTARAMELVLSGRVGPPQPEPMDLSAGQRDNKDRCHWCQAKGHYERECRRKAAGKPKRESTYTPKGQGKCFRCGKPGHRIADCKARVVFSGEEVSENKQKSDYMKVQGGIRASERACKSEQLIHVMAAAQRETNGGPCERPICQKATGRPAIPIPPNCFSHSTEGEIPGIEAEDRVQDNGSQDDRKASSPTLTVQPLEQGHGGVHPTEPSAVITTEASERVELGTVSQEAAVLASHTEVDVSVRRQVIGSLEAPQIPSNREDGEEPPALENGDSDDEDEETRITGTIFTLEDGTEKSLADILSAAGDRAITVKGTFRGKVINILVDTGCDIVCVSSRIAPRKE